MGFSPALNNLTGAKPQGYTVPGKNFGKPAMIEVVKSPLSKAITKKISQPEQMRQTFSKMKKAGTYSNGIGVGP